MQRTMQLAQQEAVRYQVDAELKIVPQLPSFEITSADTPSSLQSATTFSNISFSYI